jgi:hypothetical protein
VFMGTETNEYYLGPGSISDIAQQVMVRVFFANVYCLTILVWKIYRSVGPSGPNTEYLFNLARR